jgi:hypothetical protein
MFDIAAMCWAIAFVFQSKSTGQYAAAGIGFLVAFVGTLGMVAAEVMLSGQDLADVNTQEIGRWMVYGFIGVTAVHAALVYAHHATGPEIHEQINIGVARGEITTEAIRQATDILEAEKAQLAATIMKGITSQVRRDLGVAQVLDLPALPMDDSLHVPENGFPIGQSARVPHPISANIAHQQPRNLFQKIGERLRGKAQKSEGLAEDVGNNQALMRRALTNVPAEWIIYVDRIDRETGQIENAEPISPYFSVTGTRDDVDAARRRLLEQYPDDDKFHYQAARWLRSELEGVHEEIGRTMVPQPFPWEVTGAAPHPFQKAE